MKKLLCFFLLFCNGYILLARGPVLVPQTVSSFLVKASKYQAIFNFSGTVLSPKGLEIKPEINGIVSNISKKEGQFVKKGTILLDLEDQVQQGELSQAQATLQLRENQYKRARLLYQHHDITKDDYEQAKSQYQIAKAQQDIKKAQLSQKHILAPFSGYLGLYKVSVGSYVNAGSEVVDLQLRQPMWVEFFLPESQSNLVKPGSVVLVRPFVDKKQTIKGTVIALDAKLNNNNKQRKVRIITDNKQNFLIPGASVEVQVTQLHAQGVVKIPQVALDMSYKGNFVFLLKAGKPKRIPVKIGARAEDWVIVLSGLKPGDIIVKDGIEKIKPGVKILVKPPSLGNKIVY